MPSGAAFPASRLLESYLACRLGRDLASQTAIARDGDTRIHITSTLPARDARLSGGTLTFALDEPDWDCCRAIIAGAPALAEVRADGKPLPRAEALSEVRECPGDP